MKNVSSITKFGVTLGVFSLTTTCALAQTAPPDSPPSPPEAVLALARQAVSAYGLTPTANYHFRVPERPDQYTGDAVWEIHCGLEVDVDATQLRVISVEGNSDEDALAAAFKASTPFSITAEQASAAVLTLNQRYGVYLGDWRIIGERIATYAQDCPTWTMDVVRYVNGFPCYEDRVAADVNPYTGAVCSWSWSNAAAIGQHIAPTDTLLTIDQARQYAQTAFNQYAADIIAQSPNMVITNRDCSFVGTSGPAWTMLSTTAADSRLAYTFVFDIPGDDNTMAGGVSAVIDAQTGELWNINWDTAGTAKGKIKDIPPSPRYALLARLYKDKSAHTLALSVAEGKPAKAMIPGNAATRFTRTIGGKPIAFALNAAENRLTWERAPGQWSGVALLPAQTQAVQVWLNAPTANVATRGKAGPLSKVSGKP